MPDINLNSVEDNSINKAGRFWTDLIGDPINFPLERRIFHSISIGLILLVVIYIPYNLHTGLYVAAASAFIVGLFFTYQYYFSRYKNAPHSSVALGLAGIAVFGINYFTNSGIHGSTDLIWPAYLLLILAISPYHQHLGWLGVYLITFVGLHTLEFYYPSLVQYPFTVGRGQFIDRISAFPMPVVGIYIVIRFIRQSYDKERKLAEKKTLAVQTLMSILSHDLRAPLHNVQNYLELLATYELDSSERRELEKSLLTSTNNTLEMLSNLLHWSKSQMDGPKAQLRQLNLLDGLKGTMEMEAVQATKKGIELVYDIPGELSVIADTDMLQLVTRNLISNAIKFSPRGGEISVEAKIITDECRIAVRDKGTGMSLGQQKSIFSIKSEPAYGTANERGFGLGLVLCKEFVERQGGRIAFESALGDGTSFYIFLPVAQDGGV
jgi:two-component system sensor histidine kinase/response regulator